MKRYAYIAREADIVFLPALAPLEAAMLPAGEPAAQKRYGLLRHLRAQAVPGGAGKRLPRLEPKLRGWGVSGRRSE